MPLRDIHCRRRTIVRNVSFKILQLRCTYNLSIYKSVPVEIDIVITLTTAQRKNGLMPDLTLEAPQQFVASMSITSEHINAQLHHRVHLWLQARDLRWSQTTSPGPVSQDGVGKRENGEHWHYALSRSAGFVNQARDKGASLWLNAVPLVVQGLALNNQEFRDTLYLG